MRNRPSKRVRDLRITDLIKVRLSGSFLFQQILEHVREQERIAGSCWALAEGEAPLGQSTLYRYLSLADEAVEKVTFSSRKRLLRQHIAKRNHLYQRSFASGDWRSALAVLKDLADLQGL